jgi:hypothetical protein
MPPEYDTLSDDQLRAAEICTIVHVPEDRIIAAAIAAVEENGLNAPNRRIPGAPGVDPNGPFEMALVTAKRWKPGRKLKVRFLDGVRSIQDRVKQHAKGWEEHANVKLDFGDHDEPEIRISFQQPGSWSYLGTDALVIGSGQPTMNYGWLTQHTADDEYSRVVLHEFGHALACIHEHQHPDAGIPWDREAVYRYYQITNGWDRDKTDRNVLDRYSHTITNASEFDPRSIMQYAVPEELTVGTFSIGWNRVLSDMDKEFIGRMYPKDAIEAVDLPLNRRVSAAIGEDGEEDHFRFEVKDAGPYELRTTGKTDVVMSVHGPDDPTRLIAFDDDSGYALNAHIRAALPKGKYLVRVRHYDPTGTGEYAIRLRRR